MGQIRKLRYGYEYVSDNGIVYDIGDNGAEFNIIIDAFIDYHDRFDGLVIFSYCLVDYVCGDMEDDEVLEWIDERIERYENHERVVKFYSDKLYECYVGLKEERHLIPNRISKEELDKMIRR